MTPRPDRCHRCNAPLPSRDPDAHAIQRLCRQCALILTPAEEAAIDQFDRTRKRPWSERDVTILITAARALTRAVAPPQDHYRSEWIALIDAIDRSRSGPRRS